MSAAKSLDKKPSGVDEALESFREIFLNLQAKNLVVLVKQDVMFIKM